MKLDLGLLAAGNEVPFDPFDLFANFSCRITRWIFGYFQGGCDSRIRVESELHEERVAEVKEDAKRFSEIRVRPPCGFIPRRVGKL